MPTPAASQLADIGFDCSDEELFKSLDKMTHEQHLPGNVITDVNPHNHAPSNLPDGIWYLIHSKENVGMGQVPDEHKTDWLMHEYWIAKRGLVEDSQIKETSSLCRVFLGGEQLDDEVRQKIDSSHGASGTLHHSIQSVGPLAYDAGKPEVHKNSETGVSDVQGRSLNHQIEDLPKIDCLDREDYLELGEDYLELDDLVPASPSSSSDNSSCLTMSSDECFDSLALLRELESENGKDQPEKSGNCEFSVSAPVKPDKVVMLPASPGSVVNAEGRKPHSQVIIGTDTVVPDLINCVNKDLDDKATDQSSARKEDVYCRGEGPSSNLHDAGQSSRSPNGERKDVKGRMKRPKRKYLCFMPFYFLF